MQDITVPEEETLRALDDLVRAGKVLYLGCSNYAAYRLMRSLWLARTRHGTPFVTLQAQYSLLVRDLEREHVPLCRDKGLGILPWSPLAGGSCPASSNVASRRRRRGSARASDSRYDLERSGRSSMRFARSPANSLDSVRSEYRRLLMKPQVTSVIFGARTVEQLDANLAVPSSTLGQHIATLDQASAYDLGYPYAFIQMTQTIW
jgi:aryl-alcohol dehydrogenase-like predicted oxidoreductase